MLGKMIKQMSNTPIYLTEQETKDILSAIRIYTDETCAQYITLEDYLSYNIIDKVLTILRGE